MRSAALVRSAELLRMTGTSSTALISGLGARGALALGLMLPTVLVLRPSSANPFTIACSVFALSAGLFLAFFPTALPLPVLDGLLVGADSLLALLGIYDASVLPALPGTYVMIGTILFAVRSWPIAVTHAALLCTSYGFVLIFGPSQSAPLVRWVCVVAAVTAAGLFIRWLVEQVLALADVETKSRAAAEQNTKDLQRLSEMRSAFLARMSHELRTPLNTVLGFSELLAEQLVGPLSEQQCEYTQDITAAARHQVELVDEVLDMAKVESGLHELDFEHLDLGGVLTEAVRLVRDAAEAKGIRLTLEVAAGLDDVVADRLRIRQVLVNLLGNAVKFTPSGGSIAVVAEPNGDRLTIRVRDTGVGMTPQDLAIAFEEFARVDHRAEGTGLGLPLARRFVELHGGTLTAASRPGEGSVFSVELPRLAAPPTDRPPFEEGSEPDDALAAKVEQPDYSAFTRPGSPANRELITAITAWYLGIASALFAVLAVMSVHHPRSAVVLVAFAVAAGAAAPILRWWSPSATYARFEALAWLAIAAITALAFFADSYVSLAALAYGCVVTTGFALWPRRRAVLQLVGIAVAYAGVLLIKEDPDGAALRWLSALVMLAFEADIVNWIALRLRELVIAEHAAHETAEQARAELVAVSRHKSAFLANMSHELRTPLNAIIGFADLLATELVGPLNERQREFIADIQLAARHLLALITLALDVAKLEAGRMLLAPDVVAVRALLERAVDAALNAPDQPARCDVEIEMRPGADYVVGDAHLLQQAVVQLVGNALHFSPPDGVVSVVASPAGDDSLEIDVRDSGSGVVERPSELIFEPFHQEAAMYLASGARGAGLGLALVRGVAELHGGRVWFTTAESRGSTFSVILPRLVSGAEALNSAVEANA
ncbi:MAG: sensor histidine kinase [Jatrophihabitans sp.]|uniref:sensor histidine kinase n=1 Tax=Jatrophihabitans sp. TaxID=1932789 RepID=UPI00391117B1